MKAKDLRNSILQMAVQGKLVPQDPNDEPAAVLLERIRAERAKLIKEKKIKAPKDGESVIYRGSDGSHYEKRGKGEPICIDDEIPFEIPESWEWVRLESLAAVLNGDRGKNYPAKSKLTNKGIPFVSAVNINDGVVVEDQMLYMSDGQFNALRAGKLQRDDIVFCIRGSLGKFGVFPFERGAIASSLVIVRPYLASAILHRYLLCMFDAPITSASIRSYDNGTAQPNLAAKNFEQFLFPLPPVEEQMRIIGRLAELLPLVDAYGSLEDARELLDAELPDLLRKSILQEAVQGRLVPQDPSDEPASALLGRIRAERSALVKAGKLKAPKGGESVIFRGSDGGYYEKRGKGEPVCIDDEIPFDIPEGWEWARLGSIVLNRPQVKPLSDFCYIDIGSIDNTRQQLSKEDTIIAANEAPSRARKPVEKGDVLYATVRPYLHNACIIDRDFSLPPIASTGFAAMVCATGINNAYLLNLLISPTFDAYANDTENSKGVAYPAINDRQLYSALVPVPPKSEQSRIAMRTEQLIVAIG